MSDPECWTIGFAGKGDITSNHAYELLDLWLPRDADIRVLLPERIPRTHKGLSTVAGLFGPDDFDLPVETTDQMVPWLLKATAQDERAFLVVLGIDDTALASEALESGLIVKDLCAALDDVEFAKEDKEEEKPPSRRRRSANDAVPVEVDGPATIVPQQQDVSVAAELLEQAIRTIIKEELAVFPGAHAHTEIPGEPVDDQTEQRGDIRAYVDPDGGYRLATKRSRKKTNETEVFLTATEAQAAGLVL